MEEIRDDGTAGVETLIKFMDNLRKTIDESSNLSADVAELLGQMLAGLSTSQDGPIWHELEADPKVRDAWEEFDSIFCDTMIQADTYQDAVEQRAREEREESEEEEAQWLSIRKRSREMKPYLDVLQPILLGKVKERKGGS